MINNCYLELRPNKIRLEASTICQLSCPLCPTGIKDDMHIGRGFLKFSDFKNFIDANDFIASVELSNYGEIFLNPDLGEIIKYAHTKKVELTAINGANLNSISEETCEILVKYGFKSIGCSIDGASQDVYKMYRKGGDFNKVIENIKMINKYKKIYCSGLPLLTWQFVIFKHNVHEIKDAKKMACSLGMSFTTRASWDHSFSPPSSMTTVKKLLGVDDISFNYNIHKYYVCPQLWNWPQINWDGKLLGCCFNHWGNYGNVFQSSFEKLFNNERMTYARKMLLGLAEKREDIPCSSCHMYKEFKKKRDFLIPFDIKISGHLLDKREFFNIDLLLYVTMLYGRACMIFMKHIRHKHG